MSKFPFSNPTLLTPVECAQTVAAVDQLADRWTPRGPAFFTLGAAAYIDAPDPYSSRSYGVAMPEPGLYQKRAQETNPLLAGQFDGLHRKLVATLADQLDAPVALTRRQALPGFHIFLDDMRYANQASHVPHYDRPYGTLDWDGDVLDPRETISYTLTLELPSMGGGLKLWDVDYYDVCDLPKEEVKELFRSRPSTMHPYVVGGLICHSGNELHQIAPWTPQPGDRRITLQGHGVRINGTWELYF